MSRMCKVLEHCFVSTKCQVMCCTYMYVCIFACVQYFVSQLVTNAWKRQNVASLFSQVSVSNTLPSSCSLYCIELLQYCAANSEFHTFSLVASSLFLSSSYSFCLSPIDKRKCVKSTSKNLFNFTLAVVICLLNNTQSQFTATTGASFVYMQLNIVPSIMNSKHRIRPLVVGNPECFTADFLFLFQLCFIVSGA